MLGALASLLVPSPRVPPLLSAASCSVVSAQLTSGTSHSMSEGAVDNGGGSGAVSGGGEAAGVSSGGGGGGGAQLADMQRQLAALESRYTALVAKNDDTENDLAFQRKRVESVVAKITQEKDEELNQSAHCQPHQTTNTARTARHRGQRAEVTVASTDRARCVLLLPHSLPLCTVYCVGLLSPVVPSLIGQAEAGVH